MRVLITTDTIGGVWAFTQELAAGLLECENGVLLVSLGRMPSGAQQSQCNALARRFGTNFRYVPSDVPLEWMERNGRAFEAGARLLEREAAQFAPDILHSNQFCYGALEIGIPRVVTAHSDVLSWAKACRKEALPETNWLRNYTTQAGAGLSRADAVVAPTGWMMAAVEESFALPEWRTVIPNGCAIVPKLGGERELRAVTAGRLWDEGKGIAILEEVKSPIPLLIAGDVAFESPAAMQASRSAHFVGQLTESQMQQLLRESAVYLCLSIYEPFGLAALEAARCGCAVVARDIASLREVWEDGASFFQHSDGLSHLLEQFADNGALLENARQRSFERSLYFSRDRMVEKYCRLFEEAQTLSARAEHVA